MKIFNIILSILAFVFIIINTLKLDFNKVLEGESGIALMGIVAALIVLVLLLILKKSIAIEAKMK